MDEGAIVSKGLPSVQNLAVMLMALEKGQSQAAVENTIDQLLEATAQEQLASLQTSFMTWLKQVLLPGRLKGITLPNVNSLLELKKMLTESTIDWSREWREMGRTEGELIGEAKLLQRQLTKRFGALDDITLTRLHSATSEQLEFWAERVLDATSLQAVFA